MRVDGVLGQALVVPSVDELLLGGAGGVGTGPGGID